MRFLADENFPATSVRALRDAGHDVAYVSETAAGIDDTQVLALAVAEGRILLTLDRDHGRLLFQEGKRPPAGVIYLRSGLAEPMGPARRIFRLLEQAGQALEGSYVVIRGKRVRIRPLPGHDR